MLYSDIADENDVLQNGGIKYMKEKRLPRNGKEGFLYGSIICVITVCVMLIVNVGTGMGNLYKDTWIAILKSIPLVWVVAMLMESLVMGRFGRMMAAKFGGSTDGFNARILFNIVFVVLGMSVSMSVIGPMLSGEWIGEALRAFPAHWPRNFCAAFWCEICLAQPVARSVMKAWHTRQERNGQKDMVQNGEIYEG